MTLPPAKLRTSVKVCGTEEPYADSETSLRIRGPSGGAGAVLAAAAARRR